MWASRAEELTNIGGLKFFVDYKGQVATYADVIHAWQQEAAFRAIFNNWLAQIPFSAFRWETPGVTTATLTRPFAFVVLDSPGLARRPEASVFAEHFVKSPDKEVLAFSNLGGDAILIVPAPLTETTAYGHLATFVRQAPESQYQALWQLVGETMARRVGAKPVWLSTAGGGVSWLHVRLDDRPKYYGFAPYRQIIHKGY